MALPDVGDIAWVDLDDTRGTEKSGRRPALILTSLSFHEKSRRSIICPITSKLRDWPTSVALPQGLKTVGMVLVDQVRSIDRSERMYNTIERAPNRVVHNVRIVLAALLGIEVNSMSGDADNA